MSFSLLSQSHCTHCTDVISRWISALPRAMCLFFACHWCHLIEKVTSVTWHFCLSLHGEELKINELQHSCNEWHEFYDVEKIRLRNKQIRAGEFLFCEGAKVEKLEEEIWKHQQLLKILLQVLGWINIFEIKWIVQQNLAILVKFRQTTYYSLNFTTISTGLSSSFKPSAMVFSSPLNSPASRASTRSNASSFK